MQYKPALILRAGVVFLEIDDSLIHHHKVTDTAQYDENMKDLMTTKTGVVPARPFDGVEDASHRIEETARQQPEKPNRRQNL